MNSEQEMDFETWAKQLICRKVPENYQHLINQEVIKNGEIILRRGDAFEIRIFSRNPTESAMTKSKDAEILVTPMPHSLRRTKTPKERSRF